MESRRPKKWHQQLEWWRRLGFDAALDPEDSTIKWRTIILFILFAIACLVTFVVLCFDVVPNGANSWVAGWGGYRSPGTCEFENTSRLVRQLSTAISTFAYVFVGIGIGLFTWLDFLIVIDRWTARRKHMPPRHYCKGPNGQIHVKVTAIATRDPYEDEENQATLVSVDPEYLSGSVPSLLRREPLWGLLLSSSISLLGVTGYLFHASTTELAAHLDDVGWFAVGISFTCYSIARSLADGMSPRGNMCGCCRLFDCRVKCDSKWRYLGSRFVTFLFIPIAITLIVISAIFFDFRNDYVYWTSYAIMAVVAFFFSSLHYFGRKEEVSTWYELGLLSIFCFTVALLFYYYDLIVFCAEPAGYFQAHAVWHSFSAAALGILYLGFRSDMWMYDLVKAQEERRGENSGRGLPQLEFDLNNSQQSFSYTAADAPAGTTRISDDRRRASDREQNRISDERRRTLEREQALNGSTTTQNRRTFGEAQSTSTTTTNDQANRRRTHGDDRRRTLERSDSQMSESSEQRMQSLRDQARNRNSHHSGRKPTPRPVDSDSEISSSLGIGMAFWTCAECAFEDNEITWLSCERCNAERPPLDEFVAVSVYGH